MTLFDKPNMKFKIYIGNSTGNIYWLENGVLMCTPMADEHHDYLVDFADKKECVEVDIDMLSDEEQKQCHQIEQRLK